MASEDMGLVPSQRLDNNGINPQLLFPEDSLRFNCGGGSTTTTQQRRVGDPGPKTRELTGFIDEKMFGVDRDRYFHPQGGEYRRSIYMDAPPERRDCPPQTHNWNGNGNGNGNGSTQTHSGDGSDDDEDDDEEEDEDDDDDEVDEGDGEVEGLVGINEGNLNNNNNNNNNNNTNNSSGSVHSSADKIGNETSRHHSSFGSSREVMMTDGNNIVQTVNINNKRDNNPNEKHQQGRTGSYQNAATIVEPDGDMYYSHFINGSEGPAQGPKDMILENGYGVVGRKDVSFSSESGESLRTILSDPLTGALMDDAMILPCGHSFGGGGIQHVLKMKACYTCSQSISEEAVQPNLSLRSAVLAYRRDEELHSQRASKRRRDKFENKGNYGNLTLMDGPRGRGVQFPFVVTDRVIIKGNKRTPQRFVGREAVVTTQCLNGWYVVKTLDNAESVKLQYRSLAKVGDNPSSKPMSSKMIPNWL